MESTGCYWKPGWHLLEDQVECWLLNAAPMHNVPGRNPDDADAAWIAQLVETAGQPPARRHLRQAGRNVPFDPLCAATSYAAGKRTACRDTQEAGPTARAATAVADERLNQDRPYQPATPDDPQPNNAPT
jgi:hypothetical protein